ncbi:MAG: TetR family transcriptional regulator [Aliifodinibius sp.]|nr:TetR/AcrR family transcriptional regulator [Fodinibius sp.]NIV13233.1 TetR family transcriptional regulator [Fodinibius sp.]NIY26894.1 TetR family transcriptional regulator [Fodinibius sp.]
MSKQSKSTRQEIIEAARNEFLTHGFEGARLHNIADQIGVTKAMIHYYFNTKKELFEHVYRQSVQVIFEDLNDVLSKDVPMFKKIELLIENSLQKADQNPRVLAFVITEISRKSDWLQPIFEEQVELQVKAFEEELTDAAANYEIASVSVQDLLMNIFALCYYPVVAGPIHQSLFGMDSSVSGNGFSQQRKGVILDTILNWLTA